MDERFDGGDALMAYRKIDPRLWDDERFVDLTTVQKLLWLYLLTGPHTTSLPGLWIVGIGELVDGLRLPDKAVREALSVLEGTGMLIHNPRVRLVRVPNAPKYNRPENARVLKAWFRLWQSIPDCQQKFDHLASLRDSIAAPVPRDEADDASAAPPLGAAWATLFGSVTVPRGYTAPFGFGSRTVRERDANSSTALAFVSSGSLDPISAEIPEVLGSAREGDGLDQTTSVIMAHLRTLPRCEVLATPRQASLFAGRVHAGGILLANALEALTDGAFKAETDREQGRVRTRQELAGFLMGCVGRARATAPRRNGHDSPARPNPAQPAFAPLPAGARPWTPDDEEPS
jgi:hypothetical protein